VALVVVTRMLVVVVVKVVDVMVHRQAIVKPVVNVSRWHANGDPLLRYPIPSYLPCVPVIVIKLVTQLVT
jgi:hypothetical protein